MAKNPIKLRRRGSYFLLSVRLLGVLGLFAALFGLFVLAVVPEFDYRALFREIQANPKLLQDKLMDWNGPRFILVGLWCVSAGVVLALVALIVQLLVGLTFVAGQGNFAKANAAFQVGLVLVLLVGVNAASFKYFRRFDATRDKQFTLPESIASELRQLRGKTTVILYQRHKAFGQLSEKPDAYDFAAERKVVEKVQDLVRQFREFGPQFNVVILDVEEEGYADKLKKVTDGFPKLAKAIDSAPDNSIFFHSSNKSKDADGNDATRESVQRLAFHEFYQLDKAASKPAASDKRNLVLLPQGVEPFARRVLAIEEKRPRIAIATIHRWLTTEGLEDYSLGGLKKSLTEQGFDVVDVVLKKWGGGEPEPAASTLSETLREQYEEELASIDSVVQANREEVEAVGKLLEKLKSNISLADLNRELKKLLGGGVLTEESRKLNARRLEAGVDFLREAINQQERERAEIQRELDKLPGLERAVENKRMTDVESKLDSILAECDLLIIPRMTLRNVVAPDAIPPRLYKLADPQIAAVRKFLAAGKPVFASFGPMNEMQARRAAPDLTPDGLEQLFGQFGIMFGRQTILFNAEARAFAERRSNQFATGSDVKIPPLLFDLPKSARMRSTTINADAQSGPQKDNPIKSSMMIVAGSTGVRDKLEDLHPRHVRPVYYSPIRGEMTAVEAEFLYADPDSWNDDQPFPTQERVPRYEASKADDPARGTRDEKRRGPFPVGVAVRTTVPAEWKSPELAAAKFAELVSASADLQGQPFTLAANSLIQPDAYETDAHPTTVRIVAIGHGGWFSGTELKPGPEQLLLTSVNWLLGRDDRMPSADRPAWQFPRVEMNERDSRIWRLGSQWLLPGLAVFVGCMVLLIRRYG